MKIAAILSIVVLAVIALPTVAQSVAVPDSAAALKVAEPLLIERYGSKTIDYERPLHTELKNGVWRVFGTLCCPDRKGRRTCEVGKCIGGTAFVEIRQSDGKILTVGHYK